MTVRRGGAGRRPPRTQLLLSAGARQTVKIPNEWLTQRVEEVPTSYDRSVPAREGLRTRMAWQKLKRQASTGDEMWAFASPSNTWKKQGRYAGYALVREGAVVESVLLSE